MPRSLAASMNRLVSNLLLVTSSHSAEPSAFAGKLRTDLQYAASMKSGYRPAYSLRSFLDQVNNLGWRISPRLPDARIGLETCFSRRAGLWSALCSGLPWPRTWPVGLLYGLISDSPAWQGALADGRNSEVCRDRTGC